MSEGLEHRVMAPGAATGWPEGGLAGSGGGGVWTWASDLLTRELKGTRVRLLACGGRRSVFLPQAPFRR